ncbi:ArsR/SmtB family transcription factor [Faecalibaculum rodentium]|uniref:ArsR/SmtB family transcription factor n=1 Tax=Faecalibaculum rodentium TaxID=1702221 RepID=UPI0025A52780|nr:metalloregulator ArsR/SmtB family transcription factor [Faecalibaculum rodentium]
MANTYDEHAKVFKAFCDPKRLAILEQLHSGEKCACVLQELLDLTQSGLSYHMKILCESGIVSSRQEGKWTHYKLSAAGRDYAIELLQKLATPDIEQENCKSCCSA